MAGPDGNEKKIKELTGRPDGKCYAEMRNFQSAVSGADSAVVDMGSTPEVKSAAQALATCETKNGATPPPRLMQMTM